MNIFNWIKKILYGSSNLNKLTKQTIKRSLTSNIKKRAICVAINDYPGTSNDLRGCINDANRWSSLFKDVYKFNEVITIFNNKATLDHVRNALINTIKESNPEDVFVFTYSGHGTSLIDLNGDEPDKRDEALCLYGRFFIDDDIRKILNTIKDGVKTTIISDSCYSGTITRSFIKNTNTNANIYCRARYMPPEDNMVDIINSRSLSPKNEIFRSNNNEENMREILLTGCKDSEKSYDALFHRKYYGAMTYYATKILMKKPLITYKELHSKLRKNLPTSQYPQTPQLEGKEINKNRVIFS